MSDSSCVDVKLENIIFQFISIEDNNLLIEHIVEVEVKEAMWQCNNTKSSKYDEFNFGFIKKY